MSHTSEKEIHSAEDEALTTAEQETLASAESETCNVGPEEIDPEQYEESIVQSNIDSIKYEATNIGDEETFSSKEKVSDTSFQETICSDKAIASAAHDVSVVSESISSFKLKDRASNIVDEVEIVSKADAPISEETENTQKGKDCLETLSDPEEERNSIDMKDTYMAKTTPPSSLASSSSVEGAVGFSRRRSSSSESGLEELYKALEPYKYRSGKKFVFRRFFEEPRMKFPTRPDARKRNTTGKQSGSCLQKDDIIPTQEISRGHRDLLGPLRSLELPSKLTVNQAGAVIGYPEQMPTTEEIFENKDVIVICDRPYDSGHSLGSAETVPIDEVYIGNFKPIRQRRASIDRESLAGVSNLESSDEKSSVTSESLPGAYRPSPPSDDSDFKKPKRPILGRKQGMSQPVDIPQRVGAARKGNTSGSFSDNLHKPLSQESSSDIDPYFTSYTQNRECSTGARRKTSKDSTDSSERNFSLSLESSVDLDMYMNVKSSMTGDESGAQLLKESPPPSSGRLSTPLPIPDILEDPLVVQDLGMDFSDCYATGISDLHDPQSSMQDVEELVDVSPDSSSNLEQTSKVDRLFKK